MRARRVPRWAAARRLTAAGFLAVIAFGRVPATPWLEGTTPATHLFGFVRFTDPLAALEVSLATGEWRAPVWVGAAWLIGLALVLGPVFCGWLCPLGLLLDLTHAVRSFVARSLHAETHSYEPPRPSSRWRLPLLVAALAASLVAESPLFTVFSPIHVLPRAVTGIADGALFALVGLIALELIVPRAWCRALCPHGALYAILGKPARLRVRIDRTRAGAIRCQRCDVACPMGLRVMEDYSLAGAASVDAASCTRCGACVDVCPRGVLALGFRNLRDGALSAEEATKCRNCPDGSPPS